MNIKTTCSSTPSPLREKVGEARMRGYKNRHAELVSASQHCFPLPWRERMPAGQVRGYSLGFTLIEILVVVLIIGILGAIMLPQYQRAVLKSRYASLMPIAKAMADSNEAYFLEHGNYADNAQNLPVQGRNDYPDGTHLDFGTTSDYAYVLVKNEEKLPNNTYVMYQKHSIQYPEEIHCEALANDTLAEEVCKSFGATRHIGTTITQTYNTWLLKGEGVGIEPDVWENTQDSNEKKVISCEKALEKFYQCELIENAEGDVVGKKVCKPGVSGEDARAFYCSIIEYDEDGNSHVKTCTGSNTEYLAGGSGTMRCGSYYGVEIGYDSEGRVLFEKLGNYSHGRLYTYDEDGRLVSTIKCSTINDTRNGCSSYDSPNKNFVYKYDDKDRIIGAYYCSGSNIDSEGNCSTYYNSSGLGKAYVYGDGTVTQYTCREVDSTGGCTDKDDSYYEQYRYDGNGRILSVQKCIRNRCGASGSMGFMYDSQNRIIGKEYCSSFDSAGRCSTYTDGGGGTRYEYDNDGNVSYSYTCNSSNTAGECSSYSNGFHYQYDEQGNVIGASDCTSFNGTTCSGGWNERFGVGTGSEYFDKDTPKPVYMMISK